MKAQKTARIVTVLALVVALTTASGCALEGENFEGTFITMKLGKARASTGNIRRKNAKGDNTRVTNPFAENTNANGEVENIMD